MHERECVWICMYVCVCDMKTVIDMNRVGCEVVDDDAFSCKCVCMCVCFRDRGLCVCACACA